MEDLGSFVRPSSKVNDETDVLQSRQLPLVGTETDGQLKDEEEAKEVLLKRLYVRTGFQPLAS